MKIRLSLLVLLCFAVFLSAQVNIPSNSQVFISVNVTGFVANPGAYQLTPLNRVSDAIALAKGLTQVPISSTLASPQELKQAEQDSLFANYQGLRSVKLIRGNDTINCDILKYMRSGDMTQNPLLRDGDVITVSSIHTSVSILGEVYVPGEYEYLEGDKLSDILALAQGFTLGANHKNISIYRYKENLVDFDVIRVDLRTQSAEDIVLKAHDRISVTLDSEQRRSWKITVEGNVKAPGEYLIGENTTLYDVLVLCGGPSLRGDLHSAIYANSTYTGDIDPEFERLKGMTLGQISVMEYHFMRTKLRQIQGKYSVNPGEVWDSQGAIGNVVLRDGDYLFVPEKLDMVVVSGQVAKPGLIPWVEGKDWEYYVSAAGGYTNNRRVAGTRIISFASGNWLKPSKKVPINPGDTVFIAEKDDHEFWTDFKDVILVLSQLVTIYLGIRTITTP